MADQGPFAGPSPVPNHTEDTVQRAFDFFQVLPVDEQCVFFACLDVFCIRLRGHGEAPTEADLAGFTSKAHVATYLALLVYCEPDKAALLQTVTTLQARIAQALLAPPSQPAAATDAHMVRKTDAVLQGAALLDGRAATWEERLRERSHTYHGSSSGGGGPIIASLAESRQIYDEYLRLSNKEVPADKWADYPQDREGEYRLVAELYDAIMNMDDILEAKRPITLRPAATQNRKRLHEEAEEGGEGEEAEEEEAKSTDVVQTPTLPTPGPPSAPRKDAISVTKVKSLSRIEVEMLSWRLLDIVRRTSRGELPFHLWSGRDWSWDGQFATFRARFEAVAAALRRSKAIVQSLLESHYPVRLTAHPHREYRRKESNRSQNAERNAQVFVGRHAIGTGQVQLASTGDLQDRDGNIVAAAAADHSGLIEQTCKLSALSMLSQRSKKRAKTASATTTPRTAAATTPPALPTPGPTPLDAKRRLPAAPAAAPAAAAATAAAPPDVIHHGLLGGLVPDPHSLFCGGLAFSLVPPYYHLLAMGLGGQGGGGGVVSADDVFAPTSSGEGATPMTMTTATPATATAGTVDAMPNWQLMAAYQPPATTGSGGDGDTDSAVLRLAEITSPSAQSGDELDLARYVDPSLLAHDRSA